MRMDMARTRRALETPPPSPSLPCDQCLCPHPWGKGEWAHPNEPSHPVARSVVLTYVCCVQVLYNSTPLSPPPPQNEEDGGR